jgi:hypothetical protein
LSFSSEVSPIPFGFLIWTMIPSLWIHLWEWMQWCKIHRNSSIHAYCQQNSVEKG